MFEKTPLLEEEDKALTLLYKEEPQSRIKADVKDGFAVAEVRLQPCKEDTDNEDWEQKLDPDQGVLNTAELYIKAVATENTFIVRSSGEFLKEEPFMLKGTTATQDIYHDGTISKVAYQENEVKMKKVKFVYHDANSLQHDLGKFDIVWAKKWLKGSQYSSDNAEKKVVDGKTRYYTPGKGDTPLITPFSSTEINKRFSYAKKEVKIVLNENTSREYFNPVRLATVFGALAEVGYDDVVSNGSVSRDGTGAPSVGHINGFSMDFKYLRTDKKRARMDEGVAVIYVNSPLLDIKRQNKFLDALHKFGWGKTKKNLSHKTHLGTNLNHCKPDSHHKDHLHIQGFKANYHS